jgi:hypothetical protein
LDLAAGSVPRSFFGSCRSSSLSRSRVGRIEGSPSISPPGLSSLRDFPFTHRIAFWFFHHLALSFLRAALGAVGRSFTDFCRLRPDSCDCSPSLRLGAPPGTASPRPRAGDVCRPARLERTGFRARPASQERPALLCSWCRDFAAAVPALFVFGSCNALLLSAVLRCLRC